MTISTTTNRVRLAGDGNTTAFDFPYYFEDERHLAVYLTSSTGSEALRTLAAHYTVSGAGNAGGGTVTFVTAPAASDIVTIIRNEPLTQETDASNVGTFREQAFENQFDRHARQAQKLQEQVDRAIKMKKSSANAGFEFPEPEADRVIAWNNDATGLENSVTTGDISHAAVHASNASASAAAASVSAGEAAASAANLSTAIQAFNTATYLADWGLITEAAGETRDYGDLT